MPNISTKMRKKNYDNWSINHRYHKEIIQVYNKVMITIENWNMKNTQNDLLKEFYYFKYHNTTSWNLERIYLR